MHTVMIVDDERPARELLKLLASWEEQGFSIIAEAEDGAEAFERWQKLKPDLIISDIQMPIMDGIELLTRIRELDPAQMFVILSCHEKFSYAQAALRLNANDYIIKDSASPVTINWLLHKIHLELAGMNKLKPSEISTTVSMSDATDRSLTEISTEKWETQSYFVCLTRIEGYDFLDEQSANMICDAFRMIQVIDLIHTCNYRGNGLFALIAAIPGSLPRPEVEKIQFNLSDNLRQTANKRSNTPITISISSLFSDLDQANKFEKESMQTLGESVFLGSGKTHFYQKQLGDLSTQAELLEHRLQELQQALQMQQAEKVRTLLQMLLQKELGGIMQLNYIRFVVSKLIHLLFQAAIANALSYDDVLGPQWLPPGQFEIVTDLDHIRTCLAKLFDHYFELINRNKQIHHNYRIKKILEHIQLHYSENISLQSVADVFKIHKVHLARTFKDELQCSVNDYILKLRMEKARFLLSQTDLRIGEIALACGFQSAQTFFVSFKNTNQISPSDFRNQFNPGGRSPES